MIKTHENNEIFYDKNSSKAIIIKVKKNTKSLFRVHQNIYQYKCRQSNNRVWIQVSCTSYYAASLQKLLKTMIKECVNG